MPVRILNRFHKKQPERRPSSAQRGYDYRWQQYVARFKRDNPLCRPCEAKDVLTQTFAVDHIQPVKSKDDPLFWDEANHQPICESCHAAKSARERASGTGRDSRGQAMRHRSTSNSLRIH